MPRRKQPAHIRDFEAMNEKETLDRVLEDFRKSEAFHKEFHNNVNEWYRVYRGKILDTELREGRSNLFIPQTLANIETYKSKIINAMLAERPFVSTKVLEVGDAAIAEAYSKQMNDFLQYQFEQKMAFIPEASNIVLEALVAGVAITTQRWRYQTKKVKRRETATIDGKPINKTLQIVEKEIVLHDEPILKLVPYDRFFPDPSGTTIENCLYCIELEYLDYSELISSNIYPQDKVVKLKPDSDSINMTTNVQLEASGVNASSSDTKRGIELIHYWTDDYHIVVGSRRVLLMVDENPYFHNEKPYAKWEVMPLPNMWWGVSGVEILYNLQMELNTHRNQRIDNVSFILNKMHKVRRGANISEADLLSRPGGIVAVDEMDDIEEMEFSDVTASAYTEEAVIKKDMDTVIGVHDINRGSSTDRRETATMASITDQNSNERFTTAIKMLEFGGFKDAVAQIIQLNQQFITDDSHYLVAGQQGQYKEEKMTAEAVALEYKLVGLGKSIGYVSNRDVKQNQMTHLLSALSPYAQFINVPAFLEKLLKIFEITDVDSLVMNEQPAPAPAPEPEQQQPIQGGDPMQGQMPQQPAPAPQGGNPNDALKQMVVQIVKTLQQETGGKVPPELLAKLVMDVLNGTPPTDPAMQPVIQRITELAQQMQGGGMM